MTYTSKISIPGETLTRKGDSMATLTQEQLRAKVLNIAEVAPDEIDLQMINDFEEDDVGDSAAWEDYKAEREERTYNGNISLRVPKDLHRDLVGMAKEQGVSLNQYCLYKLAR